MPVMKECAFIILFACDYVNSRSRVKGREAGESTPCFLGEPGELASEKGLLLGNRAKLHPLCKGFILRRLAGTSDRLDTICWKGSRAQRALLPCTPLAPALEHHRMFSHAQGRTDPEPTARTCPLSPSVPILAQLSSGAVLFPSVLPGGRAPHSSRKGTPWGCHPPLPGGLSVCHPHNEKVGPESQVHTRLPVLELCPCASGLSSGAGAHSLPPLPPPPLACAEKVCCLVSPAASM